jgi:hypothetical protein
MFSLKLINMSIIVSDVYIYHNRIDFCESLDGHLFLLIFFL